MRHVLGYQDYKDLLERFCELVGQKLGTRLVSIVLYGSVARGTARRESDVDLLIVLRDASPIYYERLQPILEVVRQIRREPAWANLQAKGIDPYLSVLLLSEAEAGENRYIFLDMVADALMLVDRRGFFKARLRALEARLRQLGAKRVRLDGHWYWDLKPDLQPGEALAL